MGVPGTRQHDVTLPMPVRALGWTPDGKRLVVSGTNLAEETSGGKVAVVTASTGAVEWVLNQADPATDSCSVSSDGVWLAVSGQDAKGVLAVEDGGPRCTNQEFAVAERVAFGPDGRFVAAIGSSTGFAAALQVWVFDAATGETVWRNSGPFDDIRQFSKLAYSPDSRLLAAVRGAESFVFDAVTGDRLRTLPDFVDSVAFTPDSRTVVAGMTDGTARMIDVASGATVVAQVHDVAGLDSVAVSRDGRWAATVVEPGPAVFETGTGKVRFGPLPDIGECTKVVYGPDLRTIAVNQIPGPTPRPGIAVLSAATGAVLWSDEGPDLARDLAYSPDGSRIAVGGIIDAGQGYLRLYQVGGERLRIDHGSAITQLDLARTAPVVVTATADQKVRMYRVDAGGDPLVEGAHPSPVTSVAIGADGLSAASGCLDGNARLFKALSGRVWGAGARPPPTARRSTRWRSAPPGTWSPPAAPTGRPGRSSSPPGPNAGGARTRAASRPCCSARTARCWRPRATGRRSSSTSGPGRPRTRWTATGGCGRWRSARTACSPPPTTTGGSSWSIRCPARFPAP
jgi:WD40 repeat protein